MAGDEISRPSEGMTMDDLGSFLVDWDMAWSGAKAGAKMGTATAADLSNNETTAQGSAMDLLAKIGTSSSSIYRMPDWKTTIEKK